MRRLIHHRGTESTEKTEIRVGPLCVFVPVFRESPRGNREKTATVRLVSSLFSLDLCPKGGGYPEVRAHKLFLFFVPFVSLW
jgi:hypothetical protein